MSLWLVIMQLEAASIPGGPDIGDRQLLLALEGLNKFHDNNKRMGSSIVTFWPEFYNGSVEFWTTHCTNVRNIADSEETASNVLTWLMKDVGLVNQSKVLQEFTSSVQGLVQFLASPPDADSTLGYIGLGYVLQNSKYQKSYLKWLQDNEFIGDGIQAISNYSYQPFTNDLDQNLTDSRMYLYLRHYLNKKKSDGHTTLKLPSTWITSFTENVMTFSKHMYMPSNVNNVVVPVAANVLYGLTAAALSNWTLPEDWFDSQLYLDTVDYIEYEITHNFSSRPDFSNLYYYSKIVTYWFVARITQLLKATDQKLPYTELNTALTTLEPVLRNNITEEILQQANHDENGLAYYDGYIGNNDVDISGMPVNRTEDRIFSTSMAANALLYIWRDGFKLSPDTQPAVRTIIQQLCGWLINNTLSGKYKLYNGFFSLSRRNEYEDNPYYYPANYRRFLNGSTIPSDIHPTFENGFYSGVGMMGVVDEQWYEDELKKEHFGRPTPVDFHGYNSYKYPNTFWSSDEFTYTSVMLALTQCQYLFD
ncbi:uncharacterized protein [Dysidea avara]|uniref:uncharacterized protein n=1 Tax=Dysidea avara TaxID=196820 RepID=UPI00331F92C1